MINVNNLDSNVGGVKSKLARDVKLGGTVVSNVDCQSVLQDIDQMESWAEH